MSVLLACAECGRKLTVPETALGKKVKCPSCQAQFVAAAPDQPSAAVQAAPPRTRPDAVADRPPSRRAAGEEGPARREAPKKSGSPLLLILGVLGGLLVLCAGALGVVGFFFYRAANRAGQEAQRSLADAQAAVNAAKDVKNPMKAEGIADAEWRDFAPAGGRFSVRVPGSPALTPLPGPGGPTKYMLQRPAENKVFVVLYSDAPEVPSPQDLLRRTAQLERDNLVKVSGGTAVAERDVTVGPHPGREVQVRNPAEFFVSRFVFVKSGRGGRLYQLLVGGPGINPDAGDAARFLGSFKVEAPPAPAPGTPPPPPAGTQAADWKPFRPPQGFCVVEAPGALAPQKDPNNPDVVVYSLEAKGRDYALSWFKVTPQDAANPDFLGKLGLQVRDSLLKDHGGKVLALRLVRGAVPCREIQIEAGDKTLIVTRLYLAKAGNEDRVYQLAVTGQNLTPASPDVTRFLNSFQVFRARGARPRR
jgi:hypothetical protein